MTFQYRVWPRRNGTKFEVTVDKIDTETGTIVKTKRTGILLSKRYWRNRDYFWPKQLERACTLKVLSPA